MAQPELIFIGIRGAVVAIDKNSGARCWEKSLKGSAYVTLRVEGDRVFAGAQGEIFCLEAASGKILWHDGLKGYGLGLVSLATKTGAADPTALAAEAERQQADASSAGGVVAGAS